jgi:hypothetical protein
MQATHEEFHRLILFDSDNALTPAEKARLSAHLGNCTECRSYAQEIKQVETVLLPVLNRQWSARPIPLSLDTLTATKNVRPQARSYLTMRIWALALLFAGFVFSAWQMRLSNTQDSTPMPVGVPPIPTPSASATRTLVSMQTCALFTYQVKPGDTLASIVQQFDVSAEQVMAFNDLSSESISANMELWIPLCNFTPTSTAQNSVTLTNAHTPALSPTTSTPGG